MNENNNIPKHWQIKKLGEVCSFIGGGTPSKKDSRYWNGDINWASIKDMKGKYLYSTQDTITEIGVKESATNLANPNEIIVATRINPGRPIIAKIKTAINQDLKIVKPKKEINDLFLYYGFLNVEKEVIKLSSGSTVLGITLNNLNAIPFLLPPLPEQQAIVTKIEEIFSHLENGKQQLQTAQQQLKVYRQSLLKAAFEGKLTAHWREQQKNNTARTATKTNYITPETIDAAAEPTTLYQTKGESNMGLPEGWKVKLLGDICEIKNGKNQKQVINSNGEYPIYGSAGIMGFADAYLCEAGATIVGRKGTINKPLYVKTKFWNVDTAFGFCPNEKLINSRLLYFFCLSFNFNKLDKSTTIPSLAKTDLQKIYVPVPTIEEQQLIVDELESKLTICDKIEETISQSLQQVEALRQSVLKRAFEGRLV